MVPETEGKSDDHQRRVRMPIGGEHRTARHVKVVHAVHPAIGIDDAFPRVDGHARRPGRVAVVDERDIVVPAFLHPGGKVFAHLPVRMSDGQDG